MIDVQQLARELKRDELDGQDGSGVLYKCPAGKYTIGFGHNIEDNPISARAAEVILQDDIAKAIADCERNFPWFYNLSPVRKRVIINMVFNMGVTGVSKFKKMIAAIENEEYMFAALEMFGSRWYEQVGPRADRLIKMMQEG
jgi:lysozyme